LNIFTTILITIDTTIPFIFHFICPSCNDDNKEISKLGSWLISQTRSYKNNLYAMKNEDIKNLWKEFLSQYL